MLEVIVGNAPVFFLVAARCFALIMVCPMFSSKRVPRFAKFALAGYMAYFVFPQLSLTEGNYAAYASYVSSTGRFTQEYIFILIGEVLIGLIIGFYISVIFSAFSTSGQFFAFQMGFSASQVYDSLSEVENPLMGEFFNFIALLIFMQNHWFQHLFLGGLVTSFKSLNVFSIIDHSDSLSSFMLSSLTILFKDALTIALPLMGTLFLINVCMGMLAKAAPQMNLLAEGFPILMLTSFFLLTVLMPAICEFFEDGFISGFRHMENLFIQLGGGGVE
ncbi:MAG: flagellar biosynthetic protein FliR [Treponema sp.]|nr:flagellar biosynthetic protein FliR [Treponema sp.]